MYPQSNPQRYPKNLRLWIVIAILVSVVLVILAAMLLRAEYTQYTVYSTPLKASTNFGHLERSKLYAYNGMAFYSTDFSQDNKVSVISSGVKLPSPSKMHWAGDSGALMNFGSSFTYTEVENKLSARNERVSNETKDYTWYFDFTTNSLELAATTPILQNMVHYSKAQQGFYYFANTPVEQNNADTHDTIQEYKIDLHFYDISTKRDTIIASNVNLTDIGNMSECPKAGNTVCFIARDMDDITKVRLFSIDRQGKKTQLLDSTARMEPTNRADLYITTDYIQEEVSDEVIEESVDIPPAPAILHNLNTGKEYNLGIKLANESIVPYFTPSDEFYILNSSPTPSKVTYVSGALSGSKAKTKEFELKYSDASTFVGGIIPIVSYGDNGTVLLHSFKGDQLLLRPVAQAADITKLPESNVQKIVSECVQKHAKSQQYFTDESLFKVFFADDTSMTSNMRQFNDCVSDSNQAALLGYNYYFGVVSSFNGKIVSD